jgi:hypothetical protein
MMCSGRSTTRRKVARIYQWVSGFKPEQKTLDFVADIDGGGCIVQCGNCELTFDETNLDCCPWCNYDLIFPQAEW